MTRREDERTPGTTPDAGFTLVELLVAMGLFLLLTSMVLTMVLSASRATTDARQLTRINEEARIAMERLSRELRQAKDITAVTLPSGSNHDVTLTFEVDFNGNGAIDTSAADPEILTYKYIAADKKLTLTANDISGNPVTRPILSRDVSAFSLEFRSSLWQYDGCRTTSPTPTLDKNGVTDWSELDTPCGGGNGNLTLDAGELPRIDLVAINLSVLEGSHMQTYETQVSLRNLAQS